MQNLKYNKQAIVWLISGLVFIAYGLLFLFELNIPGSSYILNFINNINFDYIYIAAFITIFIESIYIVGTFFPGSSLVLFFAISSAIHSINNFIIVILSIFTGWVLSTIINIIIGKLLNNGPTNTNKKENYAISWFPAFRATEEVAQISSGVSSIKVFISSLKIKFITSLVMMLIAFILSKTIDLSKISSKEGFISSFIASIICFIIAYNRSKTAK